MKKLLVFCSMIVALGFVAAGCDTAPAPGPAPDAVDVPEILPEIPADEPAPAEDGGDM